MKRGSPQESLPELAFEASLPRPSFGGSLLKNSHAKTARPLSSKKALHVVLRSELAQGPRSFLLKERLLQNLILKQGRKHGVKVYRVRNGGNHLHLLVRFSKRRGFQNFLRSVCGLIARKTLRRERGASSNARTGSSSPRPRNSSFWDQRPFTRIVSWGPDFQSVQDYCKGMLSESLGFVTRRQSEKLGMKEIQKTVYLRLSLALHPSPS